MLGVYLFYAVTIAILISVPVVPGIRGSATDISNNKALVLVVLPLVTCSNVVTPMCQRETKVSVTIV